MKTKEQRQLAVKVAKDVIKQIRTKKIRPTRGTYLSSLRGFGLPKVLQFAGELQKKLIGSKQPTCRACGIGSLFLSMLRVDNNFIHDGKDSIYACEMKWRLEDAFEGDELYDIEDTFENYRDKNGKRPPVNKILYRICRNIINYGGEFVRAPRSPLRGME